MPGPWGAPVMVLCADPCRKAAEHHDRPERPKPHDQLPADIAEDYRAACALLKTEPPMAAALARRAIQRMLTDKGFKDLKLESQVAAFVKTLDMAPPKPRRGWRLFGGGGEDGGLRGHHGGVHGEGKRPDQEEVRAVSVSDAKALLTVEMAERLMDQLYAAPAAFRKDLRAVV